VTFSHWCQYYITNIVKNSKTFVFPSFQLGTVTLAGWLVGGKSCLSSVACQCVCPRY